MVMLKEVPVIPVTESVDWFQYDTGSFTGWVTQSNPYAQPARVAATRTGARRCCTWCPRANGSGRPWGAWPAHPRDGTT